MSRLLEVNEIHAEAPYVQLSANLIRAELPPANSWTEFEMNALLGSKHHFHLNSHAADAAVGEVAIQETSRLSTIHAHWRNLDKLGMIECVQRFPAKLQPPRLTQRDRFRQVQ